MSEGVREGQTVEEVSEQMYSRTFRLLPSVSGVTLIKLVGYLLVSL